MPASVTTESSSINDAGSSAFVTPLATPSGLSHDLAHGQGILGSDDNEKCLYRDDEDGTVTPTRQQEGKRERSGSQVTERHIVIGDDNKSIANGKDVYKRDSGSQETGKTIEVENNGTKPNLSTESADKESSLQLHQHELELDEKEAYSSTQSSEKETEMEGNVSTGAEKEQKDIVTAAEIPAVATENATKAEGAEPTTEEEEQEDELKYPGGFALTILTVGLAMATFVVALDNTIIGTYTVSMSDPPSKEDFFADST